MTLGKQQNNEEIIPPVIQEVEEDGEEEDAIVEIAAQKNRQRFAINKSYSIEVGTNKNLVIILYVKETSLYYHINMECNHTKKLFFLKHTHYVSRHTQTKAVRFSDFAQTIVCNKNFIYKSYNLKVRIFTIIFSF